MAQPMAGARRGEQGAPRCFVYLVSCVYAGASTSWSCIRTCCTVSIPEVNFVAHVVS